MPDDENYISKTDLKKEAKEFETLAVQLHKLSKAQREKLPASEELKAAFTLADKIRTKPDALRRHYLFMAKLLRDEDVDAIRFQYHKFVTPQTGPDKFSEEVEAVRQDLLNNGDQAINDLLEKCPSLERQKLRQLTRQAGKEVAKEKPGKSFKELFQYVKTGLQEI